MSESSGHLLSSAPGMPSLIVNTPDSGIHSALLAAQDVPPYSATSAALEAKTMVNN